MAFICSCVSCESTTVMGAGVTPPACVSRYCGLVSQVAWLRQPPALAAVQAPAVSEQCHLSLRGDVTTSPHSGQAGHAPLAHAGDLHGYLALDQEHESADKVLRRQSATRRRMQRGQRSRAPAGTSRASTCRCDQSVQERIRRTLSCERTTVTKARPHGCRSHVLHEFAARHAVRVRDGELLRLGVVTSHVEADRRRGVAWTRASDALLNAAAARVPYPSGQGQMFAPATHARGMTYP
jgi:hypothetical protein